MFTCVLLAALCAGVLVVEGKIDVSQVRQVPLQVALLHFPPGDGRGPPSLGCSGVVVSPQFILTAASCVQNPFAVRAGSQYYDAGGDVAYPGRIFLHPQYDGDDFNLALVNLTSALMFGHRIKAARLPDDDEQMIDEKDLIFSGWGRWTKYGLPKSYIKVRNVAVITEKKCVSSYGDLHTPREACGMVGGVGDASVVCVEDVGAPISLNGTVYGVVSNPYSCEQHMAAAFTRIAPLKSWIESIINQS